MRRFPAHFLLSIALFLTLAACTTASQTSAPARAAQTGAPTAAQPQAKQASTAAVTPAPTQTATLTPTPTAAATQPPPDYFCSPDLGPETQVTWAVPASPPRTQRLEEWDRAGYFRESFLFWNADNTLSLKADCGEALLHLDPSTGNPVAAATFTPTPTYLPSGDWDDYEIFSPGKTYRITCQLEHSQLYRVSDGQLLGSISDKACSSVYTPERGSWLEDESAYAYVTHDSQAMIWPVDGTPPINLGSAYAVRWSPDARHILTVSGRDPLFSEELGYINVISIYDTLGKKLGQLEVPGRVMTYNVVWYTQSVIDFRFWSVDEGYYHTFYDWASGKSLSAAYENYILPLFAQEMMLSPDQNWQVSDLSYHEPGQEDKLTYHYTLADFQNKAVTDLADGPNQQLQFIGWSAGSQTFYLVNRPAKEKAVTDFSMPFGLLALDVQSKRYSPLFEQAFFAEFSPDQRQAWVIFPAKRAGGSPGMDGAIFDLANKTLSERHPVADRLIYQEPALGPLLPVAWSHDGALLAYITDQRQVVVLDAAGQKTELGTVPEQLPLEMSKLPPTWLRLLWSPNDRWLVVQTPKWFWILDMSSLRK